MNPFAGKHAEEIRQMWQSRALAATKDKQARVLVGVLAKEYAGGLAILLRATADSTEFVDIKRPFLSGYAAIAPSGRIICDMTDHAGDVRKVEVYRNTDEFLGDFRKLADELKLTDAERTDMFAVLRRWITADLRIGPDGQKLAS
jgi:hypothetical protein